MSKNGKKKLSMLEMSEYDIISETENETEFTGIIRVRHSGTKVICRIPKHSKSEEIKLSADIAYALMQTARPGEDISHLKSIEIFKE